MGNNALCPVQIAVNTIGGKWKILIIYNILDGTKRLGELKRLIPDITQKMLAQQLRELEVDGIIKHAVYPEVPPKVEYSITHLGQKLASVFELLCQWGHDYIDWTAREAKEKKK